MYQHECDCGNEQEHFARIAERNIPVDCDKCGKVTTRICIAKIERLEPTWLADAVKHAVVDASDVAKPTDRIEFNRYLSKNNIAHVE